MKKLSILFGISVFAGAGYLVWAYSPLGKAVLSQWLIKKWQESAVTAGSKLDRNKLKAAVEKLNYQDLEVLARYTRLDMLGKDRKETLDQKTKQRAIRLYRKINERGIFKKADLTMLENIVLPG